MGSSKKHKERHSKKEHKRRRSRSRERSDERRKNKRYSPEEEQPYADDISQFVSKSRSETESIETRIEKDRAINEKRKDRDYQYEVDRKWRESRRQRDAEISRETLVKREPQEVFNPSSSGGGGDSSLSIEETNKVRVQLGLKPLDIGTKEDLGEKSYADRDDVHMPAKNMSEEKEEAKLKKKMEELREKRLMRKKLEKVKPIADDDDPILESAASWVQKSRTIDKEKKLAEERAKQLEAMDEEFGISSLASEMFAQGAKKGYTSKDLKGMKIQHESSAFHTDGPVVLTLKDKGILEEDNEDVLINVNINDDEKTKENVENRKHKPTYNAYDDAEDDTAMFKVRGVLEKYDEEIGGKKEKSFRLGAHGRASMDGNSDLHKIKEEMKAQQVSLEGFKPVLAKDFFTEEEMVKFNKPKKRRKVRKRIVKADDLVPLVTEYQGDLGSRSNKKSKPLSKSEYVSQDSDAMMDMDMDLDSDMRNVIIERPEQDGKVPFEEDEAELELQMALERSRRRTLKKSNNQEEIAIAVKATEEAKESKGKQNKGLIILDSTSEFCRALGEAETVPAAANDDEMDEENSDPEDNAMVLDEEMEVAGGWEQVTDKAGPSTTDDILAQDENVLDEEPVVAGSVGAALRLASMKGYLESGKKKERNFAALNLPKAKIVIDEEKVRDEERGRYDRGHDRERYDPYAFKEKADYKPNIRLEYIDQHGRDLTPKEAFRYLSHKFHGKGSGKMKTEKRNKKVIDDMRLQKMSSVDTPLNLVQMMSDKQQQNHSPYVVLSGSGKNLLSSSNKLKK